MIVIGRSNTAGTGGGVAIDGGSGALAGGSAVPIGSGVATAGTSAVVVVSSAAAAVRWHREWAGLTQLQHERR